MSLAVLYFLETPDGDADKESGEACDEALVDVLEDFSEGIVGSILSLGIADGSLS